VLGEVLPPAAAPPDPDLLDDSPQDDA